MSDADPVGNIVDRYMPDASPEERREAYQHLEAYIRIIFKIAVRVYGTDDDSPIVPDNDTISAPDYE